MRKLHQVVESSHVSQYGCRSACCHCGKPGTKEVRFREEDAVIVERYCDACSEPTEFQRLQEWYSRFR